MKKLSFLAAIVFFALPAYSVYYKTPYGYKHPYCNHFFIEFEGGDYRFNAPQFAFGEVIAPLTGIGIADIPELSFHKDVVDMCYTKLNLGLEFNRGCCPCWIRNFIFELGIFYATRDKNETPGDGTLTPFVFPNINGGGDFVSALSATLSGVDFRRLYRYGGMQAKVGSDLNLGFRRLNVTPFVEFDLDSVTQDYKIDVGALVGVAGTPGFTLDEHLNTNYFDFGIGVDANLPFSPTCNTFVLFGEASIFMSCGHTRFKAHEHLVTLPRVTSDLSRELDVLSAKARGQLGFGYQFGYNFMASIIAQVDYWGYVPSVRNPHRLGGDLGSGFYDRAAHIEPTSTLNYALVLSLTVTFF